MIESRLLYFYNKVFIVNKGRTIIIPTEKSPNKISLNPFEKYLPLNCTTIFSTILSRLSSSTNETSYIVRGGIVITDIGVALVNALPIEATLPDMTAQWESRLTAIAEKNASYLSFIQPLIYAVTEMISAANQQSFAVQRH